ncbi:MAG: AsmA-like C-terminal domain-containing protein [Proteobacteria bacterium]|nr:AsmA-like C-terminal domain-containing protein [Pseudomonadota bacterium]
MKFIKKMLFWTTFWTGILLIIALVISLLLPHIISPEYLKSKIVEQVSLRIGYKINLQNVDIILFPRLHADIKNTTLLVPGNFSVNINSIKAYPEIWPLLTGSVNINKLYLDAPNIKINIPERLSGETDIQINIALRKIEKKLYDFFRSRTLEKTDILVEIRSGNIDLYTGKRLYFNFGSIFSHFKLNPKHIEMVLNAKSNISNNISIKSQYFSDNSNNNGNIKIYNLNPKLLFDYLYPDSALKIADSKADVQIYFTKKGALNYNAKFKGKIDHLSFKRNNENLILNSRHLSGDINIYGEETNINIEKFILDNTESVFSGSYVVNTSYPYVQFDLQGKDIDIKETGKIVLFLTGESNTFQEIFNVLKEGKVPSVSITAKAPQVSELGNIKNIFIKGSALNTKISVPMPALEIYDIKSEVTVSGGILEAINAEGRLGNSLAQNGTFKLGLSEDSNLFYLDAFVNADISPLPSILKQVVKNKSFLKELYLIKQCEGKAVGKLTIDEKAGSYSTKVDVSKFDIKGVYSRFSNPVAVIGNKFFLDDSVVKFMVLSATTGNTSGSNLSAEFRFDKYNSFKILSEKTTIDSNEANQFILPFQSAKKSAEQFHIRKGTVTLNNIELNGPLFDPSKWVLKTDGKIDNMIVDCKSLLKEAINITNLKFNASQNKSKLFLKFTDAYFRKTFIPNLFAEFGLEKDYDFKIRSEQASIDAKEINLFTPYFQLTETVKESININKGTALLYNFNLKGPLFKPDKWSYKTDGKIGNMLVDYKSVFREPLNITKLNFKASRNFTDNNSGQNKYKIEDGYISSGKSHITIDGDIELLKEELLLDIRAFSESLYWADIKELINQPAIKSCPAEKAPTSFVKGIIRTHIDNFIYDDYTLHPVKADILFGQKKIISIAVSEANICGISLTGKIEACPTKVEFKINPFARDQEIEPCLKCFWKGKHLATGIYNLKGNIYSKGEEKEISKLLYGVLEFNASKGRIYRLGFLSKIFALLNVTEIFRGKLPDLIGEGFAYNSISIEGKLEKGNFVVSKFVIDGASMAVVCTGNIDISNNRADLIVLISPFKTVDLIIKYIPVLSQILDGNIISIPFRVLGKIEDPDVIPLSPTAVGSGLLNMLQRTIAIPVKIIQPLTSDKGAVNNDKVKSAE